MNRSFNKVYYVAPSFDGDVFADLLLPSNVKLGRFAMGLRRDVTGNIEPDDDALWRKADGEILRKELPVRDGMVFAVHDTIDIVIRFERGPQYSFVEFNLPVTQFQALENTEKERFMRGILERARSARVPYVLRFDEYYRSFRNYVRFENGVPCFSFADIDHARRIQFQLWVLPECGGREPRGEGVRFLPGRSDGSSSFHAYIGAVPDGVVGADNSRQGVVEEMDWWGGEVEIENFFKRVEQRGRILTRRQSEIGAAPPLNSRQYVHSIAEALAPSLPTDLTSAKKESMRVSDARDLELLRERFPSIQAASGGRMDARFSPSFEIDFALWRRVRGEPNELERLEQLLEIFRGMAPIVEPVCADFRIHYHAPQSSLYPFPEQGIFARILELPEHVAAVTEHEAVLPFEGDFLNNEAMRTTLEVGLSLPPPARAERAPFWTEIRFPCVRVSILDPNAFGKYRVYGGSKRGTLEFPLTHTTRGFRVYAPDIETRAKPPIHMKAVRFRDVVGMHFHLNWSPWRTKGSPEYEALKQAALGLRAKGWKLDDSNYNLFELR